MEKEKDKLFLGWSSVDCGEDLADSVADKLLELLGDEFNKQEEKSRLVYSREKLFQGNRFFNILMSDLGRCRAGLFLITPSTFKKWWIPFEAGVILASSTTGWGERTSFEEIKKSIFLLTFGDVEELGSGPLGGYQRYAIEEKKDFRDMIKEVRELLKIKTPKIKSTTVDDARKDILSDYSIGLEAQLGAPEAQAEAKFRQLVEGMGALEKDGSQLISAINTVVNALTTEDELRASIEEMVEHFSTIVEQLNRKKPGEDDGWERVYSKNAQRILTETAEELKQMAYGKLVVVRDRDTYNFYIDDILNNISESMWTTNISSYDGSHGRKKDVDVLKAHKKASDRGAVLKRIFVYDTVDSCEKRENLDEETLKRRLGYIREDNEKLPHLLRAQLENGVEPFVIHYDVFREIWDDSRDDIQAATGELKSMDFMVIDRKYLYVTTTDQENHKKVTSVELVRAKRASLNLALDLLRQFEAKSTRVTSENYSSAIRPNKG